MAMARFVCVAALVPGCGALVLNANASLGYWGDQELHVRKLVAGKGCLGGWNAINPSFAYVPGTKDLAVSFRGLCLQRKGKHASWFSKTVIGTVKASAIRSSSRGNFDWKSLHLAPDLRYSGQSKDLKQCTIPDTDEAVGEEDPRLIRTGAGLYAIVTGYHLVHEPTKCGKHGVLLHAAKVQSLSPVKFGKPVELTFEGMSQVEKNWAMFAPWDSKGASVRAIYTVYPHKIATVSLATGHVAFTSSTLSPAVAKLARRLGTSPHNFHGGAGVAHVTGGPQGAYHLSVLHVIGHSKGGRKEYWNFPYKFAAQAPYKIFHVGKKLDLTLLSNPAYGERVAFVTTVMFDAGDVFIGYGAGDRSSRTLRMSLSSFNAKYFPSSFVEGEDEISEDLDLEDLEFLDVAEFGRADVQCSSNVTAQCTDELSPSICRSCHDADETEEDLSGADEVTEEDGDDVEEEVGAYEEEEGQDEEDEDEDEIDEEEGELD